MYWREWPLSALHILFISATKRPHPSPSLTSAVIHSLLWRFSLSFEFQICRSLQKEFERTWAKNTRPLLCWSPLVSILHQTGKCMRCLDSIQCPQLGHAIVPTYYTELVSALIKALLLCQSKYSQCIQQTWSSYHCPHMIISNLSMDLSIICKSSSYKYVILMCTAHIYKTIYNILFPFSFSVSAIICRLQSSNLSHFRNLFIWVEIVI